MQTTLRIDDHLYREAKADAAREGISLTKLVEEGIRLRLEKSDLGKEKETTLPTAHLILREGVSLDDGRALRELADGHDIVRY